MNSCTLSFQPRSNRLSSLVRLLCVAAVAGVLQIPLAMAAVADDAAPKAAEAEAIPIEEAEKKLPEASPAQPRTLSVAPLNQVIYPDDRPAWIDASPVIGEEVQVWPVTSLLRPTAEEARESLRLQIRGAVYAHAEQFLGADRVEDMSLDSLLPVVELLPEVDRYAGTATLGDHTVYEEAVRLRFDEPYRRQLASAWRETEVQRRLTMLGFAGGGMLCLLVPATGVVRRIARRRSEPSQ